MKAKLNHVSCRQKSKMDLLSRSLVQAFSSANTQTSQEPLDESLVTLNKTNAEDGLDHSLEKSVDNYDEELEKTRSIWNVGPGIRPSYNLASLVNESDLLQEFLKLGVKLYKWDLKPPELIEHILKLDFKKDVAPIITFLCDHGLSPDRLDYHFTQAPQLLQQDLKNLHLRVKYLKSKRFTKTQIQTIIDTNPEWLCFSTTQIDQRLGFFQTTFKLTGRQIRDLATRGAKVITHKPWHIKDITFKLKEEMGFEPGEIVSMLLAHPVIWRNIRPETLFRRFDYLHNTVKFSHKELVRSPKLLMTREGKLRGRIGYLQHLARAQFNPEKPNYVSPEDIINGDDSHFAVEVAKSSVIDFNEYLKTL